MMKSTFLEVDPTIVERNLQVTEGSDFNIPEFPGEQYPSKIVKPAPGFCVKTKEVGTGTKIFVNICATDAIPEPRDVTEDELQEMCSCDEDEAAASEFRIPLSIGEVHREADKRGQEAKAIDVAIHPRFLDKVLHGAFYRSFLLAVVFEALADKHGIFTTDDRTVLQNRKAFGTLQTHRIQQRDVKRQMEEMEKKPLIEELTQQSAKPKPRIETVSTISAKELTLDVGEDRIILEAQNHDYFFDAYVPAIILQDSVTSAFDINTKILTVTMPIKVV